VATVTCLLPGSAVDRFVVAGTLKNVILHFCALMIDCCQNSKEVVSSRVLTMRERPTMSTRACRCRGWIPFNKVFHVMRT
jgi:hypothetical protein